MSRASEIFNSIQNIDVSGIKLPPEIILINPYRDNHQAMENGRLFFQKYYNDDNRRVLILGINPGRFGAGVTGIPFTDPKRLVSILGLPYKGKITHEPSSAFIYDMIAAFGGAEKFYGSFYINSLFPLTIVKDYGKGKVKNYNFYDDKKLFEALTEYIVQNIKQQSAIAGYTKVCICIGTGRNAAILQKLNDLYGFFEKIVSLEHPRFIAQYKNRDRQAYIDKYIRVLNENLIE